MPTPKHPEHDPRPFGDPQPGQPDEIPQPTGDPRPDREGPDSNGRLNSSDWAITASKKVDDISKHESWHDSDPKHDPKHNAREKTPDGTKPDTRQPQGEKPLDGNVRK